MTNLVRTHPRGATGAAIICSLGLLLACCGCQSLLWKPEPPKAVSIVIQADGSITVDGKPAGPRSQWAELLKKEVTARKAALRTVPPPAVLLPTGQRPREVLINVASPEKTKYEDFCQVFLACAMAELYDLDLEGVPFTAPSSSSPRAAGDVFERPPSPPFLPMEIRNTADLDRLRKRAKKINGGGILLCGTFDCPMDLVIAAAKVIRGTGVPVAFAIPYEDAAGTSKPPLVLEYAGVDGRGNFVPTFAGIAPIRLTFFGVPLGDPPRKIVFIVDRSGSMTDSIDFVKYTLKRCVGGLAESDQFNIIFFSSGPPVEMPPRRLVAAEERIKQMANEFIDAVVAQGETDPSRALHLAFAQEPDTIVLLTDGEFDRTIADQIRRLNVDKKVAVNTIGFLYSDAGASLKPIADENDGVYKFVSEADLAALSEPER